MLPRKSTSGLFVFTTTRLRFFLALFAQIFPLPLWGQQILYEPETKKITYSAVIEVEGVSKEELYARAKKWFNESNTYLQSKSLLESREQGHLVFDAGFYYHSFIHTGQIFYSCIVSVQENKYRYIFTHFKFQIFKTINYQGYKTFIPTGPPLDLEDPNIGSKRWILKEINPQIQFQISDLHHALARKSFLSINNW